MGFDDGGIILDREDGTYYTGQVLRGRLEFDLSNVKTFRGIYVELKGFCKVHWTTSHSRRDNDRTVHYTVVHESNEDYVNFTTYLVGSKSGEIKLPPGHHVFPFEFQIPQHCPSSFEGSDGHIRYQVKATCDRAFKLDQHKTAVFRLLAPVDLNANPDCKEPFGMEFYNSYCCWCMSAGKCEAVVKSPAGGACPNQILPVEVSCKNDSTVTINAIRIQIRQVIVYHAQCEPDTRSYEDNLLEVKKGPIPGHTERHWVVDMQIPDMDVPNVAGCRFIEVLYKFKVLIETSGCHKDDDDVRQFTIGTIPLTGPGSQPIAPTEHNPVSLGVTSYPSIMNQPVPGNPPYPNIAPYPSAINSPQNPPYPVSPNPIQPYPSANPPYPNSSPYPNQTPYLNVGNIPYSPSATSPYPTPQVGTNAPYPTDSNAPYPNVSPYPPNPSPYPSNPSPYPPSSSPYPPNPSPYPPNSSPNPPNPSSYPPNPLPYPPNSSPNPPNPSPYPPNSSPYSPNVPYENSPKPAFTGSTLLKTGNIGFIGSKTDSATMPLLPPGSTIPPYPTSPYASASAPVPATPNDESNKFNHSPFNPEFKDNDQK